MSTHLKRLSVLLFGSLGLVCTASADTVTTHEPGTYKMTEFDNTDENIPLNGPIIHVFSKDGNRYTSISNDNENLKHASVVGGI